MLCSPGKKCKKNMKKEDVVEFNKELKKIKENLKDFDNSIKQF